MLPIRAAGPGSTSMTSRPSGAHPASQPAPDRGPPPPRRGGRGGVVHLHAARAAERHQVVTQADALRDGGGAGPNVDELAQAEKVGEALANLPHRHRRPSAPPLPSASPRGIEPRHGAFADQLSLELGQRAKMPNTRRAACGRGVDLRALADEHAQVHAAARQVVHGVDQVGEVPAESVELPDDEHVILPQGPAGSRSSPGRVVPAAGRQVVVDV